MKHKSKSYGSKKPVNKGATHKPLGRGVVNLSKAATDNYVNNYGKRIQPGG